MDRCCFLVSRDVKQICNCCCVCLGLAPWLVWFGTMWLTFLVNSLHPVNEKQSLQRLARVVALQQWWLGSRITSTYVPVTQPLPISVVPGEQEPDHLVLFAHVCPSQHIAATLSPQPHIQLVHRCYCIILNCANLSKMHTGTVILVPCNHGHSYMWSIHEESSSS